MKENGKPMAGDTNIVAGVTFVYSGSIWLQYPETAHELIQMAQNHGWGFDDGLPPRIDNEGCVFVRILLGREPGENALKPGEKTPGVQFHVSWRMPHPTKEANRSGWSLGGIYVKTSETSGWSQIRSIKSVRSHMANEPVQVPDGYVPVNA